MIRDRENEKKMAALEAVKLIRNDQIVGLGTGSSATYAIHAIGELVKNGLQIKGVATSIKSTELAQSLNIPLIDIHSVDAIDITIDGADEFTEDLILIKGGGGALLREKIVASLTKEEIIITDSSKKVEQVGKFTLPVEVVPFALHYVLQQLQLLKGTGKLRMTGDKPFTTDGGNYIIDTDFGLMKDPVSLSDQLNKIVGLVEHGLFINLAARVIMGNQDSTVTFMLK